MQQSKSTLDSAHGCHHFAKHATRGHRPDTGSFLASAGLRLYLCVSEPRLTATSAPFPPAMNFSRAALFDATGKPFRFESVPIPAPGTGEILVRNEYTTLCRSDLYTYLGKRTEKTPTILGHEIIGRIESLGIDAPAIDCRGAALRAGDRITWAIYASDPCSCMARAGMPQKAPDLFKYGHEQATATSHLHGGLAEHCLLRRHTPVARIDADVPLPVLALINCSFATVAGSLRLAGSVTGRTVLITGTGMLGLVAAAMCRTAGARQILAVDISAERLAASTPFGVTDTFLIGPGRPDLKSQIAAHRLDQPVTIAIDCSGVPETMEGLLEVLGIGGTAVFVGAAFPQRRIQIDAEQVVRRLLTIRGLHNYNLDDFIAAVGFVEQHHHRFPFADLIQDRFTLDEVDAAFAHAASSEAHRVGIRTIVRS